MVAGVHLECLLGTCFGHFEGQSFCIYLAFQKWAQLGGAFSDSISGAIVWQFIFLGFLADVTPSMTILMAA